MTVFVKHNIVFWEEKHLGLQNQIQLGKKEKKKKTSNELRHAVVISVFLPLCQHVFEKRAFLGCDRLVVRIVTADTFNIADILI